VAYRFIVFALVLGACGRDTGLLLHVARDASLTQPIERLRFVFGDNGGQGTVFLRTFERTVDVTGRDLASSPYQLLVRPESDALRASASITVAVVAEAGDAAVGYGALAGAQTFTDGEVLRRDVVLLPDDGQTFVVTPTGCLLWPEERIIVPDDRDCDGDPAATDCNDADPTVNRFATEVCGNNRDDNCNGMIDEGCPVSVCTEGETRACYEGAANTANVGACRGGVQTCRGGQWSACVGQVLPSAELCNGVDDDCDGMADDSLPMVSCGVGACARTMPACTSGQLATCTPAVPTVANDSLCNGIDDDCDGAIDEDCACVHVTPSGNDTMAASDPNVPFATIPAAIAWAAAEPSRPKIVCVAAGPACGANATFASPSLVMANGISVYGNYEATTWTPCAQAPTAVKLQIAASEGVLFPSSVTSPTTLANVSILEPNGGGSTATTRAAITVDGATHVLLTNLAVQGFTSNLQLSVGVDLKNGADATITRSQISAGSGSLGAYAIRSKRARPTVRGNCPAFDARGRCNTFCTPDGPGLRGRQGGSSSGESFVVLLEESPGALVESNALCGAAGATGAGVRVKGDAAKVLVRGNYVSAFGSAQDEVGVWLDDCNDATPYILDNPRIEVSGGSNARVTGVRVAGRCHPVVEANDKILGGVEGGSMLAEGVSCGANGAGAPSGCVIADNLLIEGRSGGTPPTSVAVRCDGGACARVSNNVLDGRGGQETIGLWLVRSAALVDRNRISGGCGASAIGVRADDAASRLENNRVVGGLCESAGQRFVGLRATVASGPRELDVHSNTLDGGGGPFACRSAAVELAVGSSPPAGGVGVFRNNIFRGGLCMTARVDFSETAAAADPRILDHNDFDPTGPVTAIYRDEDTRALQTLAELDALTDAVVTGNISVDPKFVSYPNDLHLADGSQCIDAGTTTGAPARDMDNMPRDARPDIGADEK